MPPKILGCDIKHVCPTCRVEFYSEGYNTAHLKMYYHMVKTHAMRINVGCHPNCTYAHRRAPRKAKTKE